MNLLADYFVGVGKNARVPTLEGDLVRKWRIHLGITQPALGAACDPPMGKNGIYRIERGESRLAIDTLLKVVEALERSAREARPSFSFGESDSEKLSMFFRARELTSSARTAPARAASVARRPGPHR